MTLYLLFVGLAMLSYVATTALRALSGALSRHVVFAADFGFLASLSMLLVATIVVATRSLRVSALIVALMSGAAVTMMIAADRGPSATQRLVGPQQPRAVVVAVESVPQQAAGERLFQELGCVGCHRADGTGIGPALAGVFGGPMADPGCGVLTADEEYLRESILNPTVVVAAGFAPIMPSFAGRLNDEQLRALIAYVKSLRVR
jgi:mono/diheme cytochrome c family protein